MKIRQLAKTCLILAGFLALAYGGYVIYYFKWVLSGPGLETPFVDAHEKAVRSFAEGKHFGIVRFRKREHFNERSVDLGGVVWDVDEIYLVGATPEYGKRYFSDGFLTSRLRKDDLAEADSRPLMPDEIISMSLLGEKKSRYYLLGKTRDGGGDANEEVRVLAPLFADESCVRCHQVEVGEMLGVFDYHLSR